MPIRGPDQMSTLASRNYNGAGRDFERPLTLPPVDLADNIEDRRRARDVTPAARMALADNRAFIPPGCRRTSSSIITGARPPVQGLPICAAALI
jgi:hypothetical protein